MKRRDKYNYSSRSYKLFNFFFINTNNILLKYGKTIQKIQRILSRIPIRRKWNTILKTSINHSILCNIFLKKNSLKKKKKEKKWKMTKVSSQRVFMIKSSTNHDPTFSTIRISSSIKSFQKRKMNKLYGSKCTSDSKDRFLY